MEQCPSITRDPIRDEGAEPSCLAGLALFVWLILSWIGVELLDSLEPLAAAALLFATLLWLAWAWGVPWLALGVVALLVALVAGHDGRSVALIWYQVFAGLTVAFGMAIVYGPSPEHLMPAVIMVVLALVLFPVFARAREEARRSSCLANEKQIATAVLHYAQDYDGHLPPTDAPWSDVVRPYVRSADVSVKQVFECLADQDGPPSYQLQPSLRGTSLAELSQPENTVMLFESDDGKAVAFRHLGGTTHAYVDGHVKWLSEQNSPPVPAPED